MKARLFTLKTLIVAAFGLLSVTASAQDEYSRDITYLSGKGNTILLQVAVQSSEKKTAEALACKSIIDTYLFYGIEGVGTGAAVVDPDDVNKHRGYFNNLFNRFTVFANSPKKIDGPKKNAAGLFEATYNVTFRMDALDKDLVRNKIIADEDGKGGVTKSLPTIMVIPFRKEGQNYRYILDHNSYIRTAIGKVQESFSKAGYTTIDFIAKLEAAERHNNFSQDNAESFAAQLIRTSGSDIYVSVDCTFAESYSENRVNLVLKAYYTATGNITASETANFTGKLPFDRCCVGAVHRAMPNFMKQIKWPPSKTESRLAIGIDQESMLTLESLIGNQGATIGEEIRAWVKANAKAFHQQGLTETELIFDSVTLPDDCDATDFAIKLRQNLRRQGVNSKYNIDGLSIYLTITD